MIDVGRKTRAIPPSMRRALAARDEGCRFPGCTNKRFVDAHHIQHWINGGETNMDNLVTLCRRHHRFVHEYGFQVERAGDELRFTRPDGKLIPNVPSSERIEARKGEQALKGAHERQGIAISARTGVPKWFGERIDYHEVVGALQDRAAKSRSQSLGPEEPGSHLSGSSIIGTGWRSTSSSRGSGTSPASGSSCWIAATASES